MTEHPTKDPGLMRGPRRGLTRRGFIAGAAGASALSAGAAILPTHLTLAAAPGEKRLAIILLRGGFDGMTLLPPTGDRNYVKRRGALALPRPETIGGLTPIGTTFALHPAARALLPFWTRGQLAFVPSVAGPDRSRDHKTAQTYLESATRSDTPRTGWLNRALSSIDGASTESFANPPPLILRGLSQGTIDVVETDAPVGPGFYEQVRTLYQGDGLFAPTLARGLREHALRAEALGVEHAESADGGADPIVSLPLAAAHAGRGFAKSGETGAGPRVAVIDSSGWDTHVNQGRLHGRLPARIALLSEAISRLAANSGEAWKDTIVVVMSEFGRSVLPNDTGGTDHGTGGLVMVLGGAAIGGIKGEWPGLGDTDLLDGRDLRPTVDIRGVLKRVLQDHMKIPRKSLDKNVFPGSEAIPPLAGLVRE